MKSSAPPIRVLVVDDSSVARRIIAQALESAADIVVKDTASDGIKALEALKGQEFDLVMMDVEMPQMDGIAALKEIRKADRLLPVILFSALSHHGATATIEGLANGANDYCPKPSSTSGPEQAVRTIRDELVPRIRVHTANARKRRNRSSGDCAASKTEAAGSATKTQSRKLASESLSRRPTEPRQASASPKLPVQSPQSETRKEVSKEARFKSVVQTRKVTLARPRGQEFKPLTAPKRPIPNARVAVIGSSTGGPQALLELVTALADDFPLPLVVVQHMPKNFTKVLSERLDSLGPINVHEAEEGEPLQQGAMLFAPGGMHLEVIARGPGLFAHLSQAPMVNSCRPSVDVTLNSVHQSCKGDALVTILTGMGRDGAEGCKKLSQAGAHIIAQDEESSVVWGMPGAVVQEGVADQVLPLSEIPNALTQTARRAIGSKRKIA